MSDVSKIFKAYDMRGVYPIIDERVMYLVGVSFVQDILIPSQLPKKVAVGHDCRISSPRNYAALIAGLRSQGCEVLSLGLATTDLMYASAQHYDCSGMMVTASHNPKQYNGCKIVKKSPEILGLDAGLDIIRDYVVAHIENFELPDFEEVKRDNDVYQTAMNYIVAIADTIGHISKTNQLFAQRGATIVVDSANGMGVIMANYLKASYPSINWVLLYNELDGDFPNHPADPSNKDNLQDLIEVVRSQKALLGIAFDGDADRAYFVDENGDIIDSNYVTALFAQYFVPLCIQQHLPFTPGVVYSQPQSRSTPDATLMVSGVAIPAKQGHTNIKAKMKEFNAIYGGEGTGHHYFGQFGYMDSGVLAVVTMLKLIADSHTTLSQLIAEFRNVYHLSGEYNFEIPDGVTVEEMQQKLLDAYLDGTPNFIDGITIFYYDWKLNLRSSNTEPLVRLNIETIGVDNTQEKLAEVRAVLGL